MWNIQDAKNKFSAVVDEAMAGRPQEVTKRGKPAVVVISSDEYARLVEAAGSARGRFSDHLLSFPSEDRIERAKAQPRDIAF